MPDEGQPSAFERYVRGAIAKSSRVHSVSDLLKETGLHRNTIYDLFNGDVSAPGPRTVTLLADALDVPMVELWAAWEGKDPPPDTVQEALRRHTEAIEAQNVMLAELVGYVRRVALGVLAPDPKQLEGLLGLTGQRLLDDFDKRLRRPGSTPESDTGTRPIELQEVPPPGEPPSRTPHP